MRITDERRLAWGETLRHRLAAADDMHMILEERADAQEQLDQALSAAVDRVGQEKTQESEALAELEKASEDAGRRARLVAVKLESAQLEGQIDTETYNAVMAAAFPQGAQTIPPQPRDRHDALARIVSALEQHPDADPKSELRQSTTQGQKALEQANERAKKEQSEHKAAHDALEQARHAWDEGYLATKEIVSGVLRSEGRREELPRFFPDLGG